jgi:DNA recombination protein RmuC
MVTLTVVLALVVVILAAALLLTLLRRRDQNIQNTVKTELQTIAQSALAQNSELFLDLANERLARQSLAGANELDTKKQLIDQQLVVIGTSLERVNSFVQTAEKEREAKFSELGTQIKSMGQQTVALTASTGALREAMSSSRARGQWGERMAEDILKALGLNEGVNYNKQVTLEGIGSRPDFVFLLPENRRMNMDVKFPLDNYLRYLDATADLERETFKNAFLKDARDRIKEITTREYIDPTGGTIDFVLLFIPSEAIYSFMHQQDAAMLDYGLQNRVVCCSPFTLFAVLAIVRQAVSNFALLKASEEIIGLFGRFNIEWLRYVKATDDLGRHIDMVKKDFDTLASTRKRALERPLTRIEDLRQRRGIDASADGLDAAPGSLAEAKDDPN